MTEWILAFDAGCGSCTDVINRVGTPVADRLTIAGLDEERVQGLRTQALGPDAPFAPTLLEVQGDRVRGWTGPKLSLRLGRLLGPARSLAVVRALNEADVLVHGSRRTFLKAVPAVTLGAFLLSGGLAAPAMASTDRRTTAAEAAHWAAKLAVLPTTYADVTALPLVKRKAVHDRLPIHSRVALWQEHLRRFQLANPKLSATQLATLDKASAALPQLLGQHEPVNDHQAVRGVAFHEELVAALGRTDAYAAVGVLGEPEHVGHVTESPDSLQMMCDCYPGFSGCSSCGWSVPCTPKDTGCGAFWSFPCYAVCGG